MAAEIVSNTCLLNSWTAALCTLYCTNSTNLTVNELTSQYPTSSKRTIQSHIDIRNNSRIYFWCWVCGTICMYCTQSYIMTQLYTQTCIHYKHSQKTKQSFDSKHKNYDEQYADDTNGSTECINKILQRTKLLSKESQKWGLNVNTKKTKIMHQ